MRTVVFTHYFDRANCDESVEVEIEAQVIRAFKSYKVASYRSMTIDGLELSHSDIEDLVEEIGQDELDEIAIAQYKEDIGEGDLFEDADSHRLNEELGIKVS